MPEINEHARLEQIFDDYSNPNIHLYFASYDNSEDLCKVINWPYIGKPSASSPGERYFGWIAEHDVVEGDRITAEELRRLIEDEEHNAIVVLHIRNSIHFLNFYSLHSKSQLYFFQ